ncbi:hypothetical protein F5Y11DRAFT_274722 [Daldinia sp. FL1419]|nr:hypothetical protein F5Y11DRAFT_274722 [Daldinia sp. FL1419]
MSGNIENGPAVIVLLSKTTPVPTPRTAEPGSRASLVDSCQSIQAGRGNVSSPTSGPFHPEATSVPERPSPTIESPAERLGLHCNDLSFLLSQASNPCSTEPYPACHADAGCIECWQFNPTTRIDRDIEGLCGFHFCYLAHARTNADIAALSRLSLVHPHIGGIRSHDPQDIANTVARARDLLIGSAPEYTFRRDGTLDLAVKLRRDRANAGEYGAVGTVVPRPQ